MYQEEKSFEERCAESGTMLQRFSDRVPVIIQKKRNNIDSIDKRKFMTPRSLTLGQLLFVVRRRLKLKKTEAIFLFINGKLIKQTETMGQAYNEHKNNDGFLYVMYDFENTFGH